MGLVRGSSVHMRPGETDTLPRDVARIVWPPGCLGVCVYRLATLAQLCKCCRGGCD